MFDSDFVRSLSIPIYVDNILNTLKRLKRLWPTTSPALPAGGFDTISSAERDLGAWLDAHRESRPTLTPGLSGFLPDEGQDFPAIPGGIRGMPNPGVSFSDIPYFTSLLVRVEKVVAWGESTPRVPEEKLAPIRRAARDLRAWLDAYQADKPILPPGVSPFLPKSDPPIGSAAGLRPILAAIHKDTDELFDFYVRGLEVLQGEEWTRAREVMGDVGWALGFADMAAQHLP